MSNSLRPHGLYSPGNSPGQNTGVVAFPFFRGSFQPGIESRSPALAGGFFTIWATREAQENWSGKPIPSPEDLPDPGIKLGSPALQADSWPIELPGKLNIENAQQQMPFPKWKKNFHTEALHSCGLYEWFFFFQFGIHYYILLIFAWFSL